MKLELFPRIPLQEQLWHFAILASLVGAATQFFPDIKQQSHENALRIEELSAQISQLACVAIINPKYTSLPSVPEKRVEYIAATPFNHYSLLSLRTDPEAKVILAMDSIIHNR